MTVISLVLRVAEVFPTSIGPVMASASFKVPSCDEGFLASCACRSLYTPALEARIR